MTPLPPRIIRAAAVTITVAAAVVLLVDAPGPIRVAIVIAYFLTAPGFAALPALSIDSAVGQVAAAVGLSVAALILVSEALLYVGVSGAGWAFATLASLTLLACARPTSLERQEVDP